MIIEFIRKATHKICDVHLMIEEPEKYAEHFKNAGADILTVHIETCTFTQKYSTNKKLGHESRNCCKPTYANCIFG
jgi:pentose-5-phosphate-3-epimerase